MTTTITLTVTVAGDHLASGLEETLSDAVLGTPAVESVVARVADTPDYTRDVGLVRDAVIYYLDDMAERVAETSDYAGDEEHVRERLAATRRALASVGAS